MEWLRIGLGLGLRLGLKLGFGFGFGLRLRLGLGLGLGLDVTLRNEKVLCDASICFQIAIGIVPVLPPFCSHPFLPTTLGHIQKELP